MPSRIGILLPRSIEYPSIGFDLLDGLRVHFRQMGFDDYTIHTENIGFGEDPEAVHAAAEKLLLNNEVDLLVVYATSLNAENLYSFATSSTKPILFLDAGMEFFEAPPNPLCYHLTLQGLQACYELGKMTAAHAKKIAFASSFLDGGYRGGMFLDHGLNAGGAEVIGHYVSLYRAEEFSLANLEQVIERGQAQAVITSFSSYLAGLFLKHLQVASEQLRKLPFYCSPFFAEETILDTSPFPGTNMITLVPWARSIESSENQIFMDTIKKEKNKTATIFHLLGWEAALVIRQILSNGIASLDTTSFETPRGTVRFHPDTHCSYAPLYEGHIVAGENQNARLVLDRPVEITAEAHLANHMIKPTGEYTRWKNNFFCI